jgi:hypothetical protein
MTTVLENLLKLPQAIDYCGFRFIPLCIPDPRYGPCIGYYLSECLSKKKYKRTAFNSFPRFWTDKNSDRWLDSVGTNILLQQPIFDMSDESLVAEIQKIIKRLTEYGIMTGLETEIIAEETEYEDIPSKASETEVRPYFLTSDQDFEKLRI